MYYSTDLPIRKDCKDPIRKREIANFKEQIFIIRAYSTNHYGSTRGKPSRDIAIRGSHTLEKLVEITLKSFEFENDHLHVVSNNMKEPSDGTEVYASRYDEDPLEQISTDMVIVAQIFDKKDKKMLIQFDMGEDWRFIVQLIEVRTAMPLEKRFPYFFNIKGEGPEQYPYDQELDDYYDDIESGRDFVFELPTNNVNYKK